MIGNRGLTVTVFSFASTWNKEELLEIAFYFRQKSYATAYVTFAAVWLGVFSLPSQLWTLNTTT